MDRHRAQHFALLTIAFALSAAQGRDRAPIVSLARDAAHGDDHDPAASFTPLSGISGSADMLFTYHMSDDGGEIVGEAPPTDGVHGEGVVATRESGGRWSVRPVGTFASSDTRYSPAYGASHGGMLIVGVGSSGDPAVDMPYQWDPSGLLTPLGLYPGDRTGEARAIAFDGRTIIGWGMTGRSSRFGPDDPYRHALRWPVGGSVPELIDAAPDAPAESVAMASDRTGRIVAGFAVSDRSKDTPFNVATDSRGHEGIVWFRGDDGAYRRVWLGFINRYGTHSRATVVSERGDRLAGFSGTFGASRPVVWTWSPKEGYWIRDLGVLPGFEAGGASAISADGRVIVGNCYRGSGDTFVSEAFLWDEKHGIRNLRGALQEAGVTAVVGWNLVDATGVSRDGTWISGHGTDASGNFTAWVARLP